MRLCSHVELQASQQCRDQAPGGKDHLDYGYEAPTLCSPLCFPGELEGINMGGDDA